jgi:D-galactonate transporter
MSLQAAMPTMTQAPSAQDPAEVRLYRKVTLRLIPLLFISYLISYLDRVNVGFAKLQMATDLKFSDSVYGLGAGIFFLGYILLEIPSNLILHRVGARVWIARIMIVWGLLSAGMMWVSDERTFYLFRLALGAAEAGFFPGVILYLTYWFPAARRARITSMFMTAIALSGVVGGPLSGWILQTLSGANGWAGWQWLFLLEGIPAVVLGLVVFFYLDDRIQDARWLSAEEKKTLERGLEQQGAAHSVHSVVQGLTNGRVWLLGAIYFCVVVALYATSFWLPTIIKAAGARTPLEIGLLAAVPYGAATISMLVFGWLSDRRMERRWHAAVPMFFGAVGLLGSTMVNGDVTLSVLFLALGTAGILGAFPVFWSMPTTFLGGAAAAAGIALINSLGNVAGFAASYVVGYIKDVTHSTDPAMYLLAGCLVLGAVLLLTRVPAHLVDR